jgi:hypothetical protein
MRHPAWLLDQRHGPGDSVKQRVPAKSSISRKPGSAALLRQNLAEGAPPIEHRPDRRVGLSELDARRDRMVARQLAADIRDARAQAFATCRAAVRPAGLASQAYDDRADRGQPAT